MDEFIKLKAQMEGAIIWGMPLEEANNQVATAALKMLPIVRALCDNPRIAIAVTALAYMAVCQAHSINSDNMEAVLHGMLDEMRESVDPAFFTIAREFIK